MARRTPRHNPGAPPPLPSDCYQCALHAYAVCDRTCPASIMLAYCLSNPVNLARVRMSRCMSRWYHPGRPVASRLIARTRGGAAVAVSKAYNYHFLQVHITPRELRIRFFRHGNGCSSPCEIAPASSRTMLLTLQHDTGFARSFRSCMNGMPVVLELCRPALEPHE